MYVLGERGSGEEEEGGKALGKEQRRANTWTSGSLRTLFQPIFWLVSLAEHISGILSLPTLAGSSPPHLALVLNRM